LAISEYKRAMAPVHNISMKNICNTSFERSEVSADMAGSLAEKIISRASGSGMHSRIFYAGFMQCDREAAEDRGVR
jgi:hypothetical protein